MGSWLLFRHPRTFFFAFYGTNPCRLENMDESACKGKSLFFGRSSKKKVTMETIGQKIVSIVTFAPCFQNKKKNG